MRVDLTSATAAAVLNDAGQGAAQANQTQRKAAADKTTLTAQTKAEAAPPENQSPAVGQSQAAQNQVAQNQPAPNQAAVQARPAESTIHVPPAIPAPEVMNVTFDQNKNTVYRFVDEKSGELVRQVPPEEVLRVMRSVEDMLQESEPKLKVAL
ncbi:MAG TPA: hypothetical protein VMH85_15160 [Terriglobales bacterium]|nr:hypothetical protein [Terriglobales bacterium]